MMFNTIDPQFNLQTANFGTRNDRVLVIALKGATLEDEWEQIEGSRILLIGGEIAREELKRFLDTKSGGLNRKKLKEQIPGGMNSRTHTAMRKFCGL
ncbi:MAG: hypothetical protein ACI9EW_002736 [Cellvibrionaceae bacterium]|jgi:hypothetical protein